MRHTDTLLDKGKTHEARQIGPMVWKVTSGSSGKTYSILDNGDGTFRCTCKWGFTGNGIPQRKACVCSHTLAVMAEIEKAKGRKLSAFATEERAKRQRKPVLAVADGIITVSRS